MLIFRFLSTYLLEIIACWYFNIFDSQILVPCHILQHPNPHLGKNYTNSETWNAYNFTCKFSLSRCRLSPNTCQRRKKKCTFMFISILNSQPEIISISDIEVPWSILWSKSCYEKTPQMDGLDYGEEVHHSRVGGEWSNMLGYEMDSSLAGIYTLVKEFLWWRISSMNEKNDMDASMVTFFARGLLRVPSFLGNHNPAANWPLDCVSTFSSIPIVASSNLVLGWDSWPTGALLHYSLNRP